MQMEQELITGKWIFRIRLICFFMGVGDYAVIKDSYKGKEVSYYVEKEYAPVARVYLGIRLK